MPVKLQSQGGDDEGDEARIEIIPLIDIMFFLLAAFMLVSLSMTHVKRVPINLPTASSAQEETTTPPIQITIDAEGVTTWDSKVVTLSEITDSQTDQWGRLFTGPELQPPFYAVKVTGALFHTQGGLNVDTEARVLRPAGRPLPNLFAGGGVARGLSGRGPSGYLPGAGLCTAIALGYAAGKSAADLVSEERPKLGT